MTESTALFHRPLTMHELVAREITVAAVTRVAPDMIRVSFMGADLADFQSDGASDHVKLFFPQPDGTIHTRFHGDPALVISRDFTPLPRETQSGAVLDIDFFVHADPGPASSWAASAAVGDRLAMGGPRGSRGMPVGAEALLLIADETALPSARRWIAGAGDVPVTLIATVSGDGAWVREYVHAAANVDVRITTPAEDSVLAAADAAAPVGERTFVWAAGNAATLLPLRRKFRREWGLPAAQVSVDGYWRGGVVAWDHHAPIDPTDPD